MQLIERILKSKFIANLLIYGVGAVFLRGVSFLLIPLYTRVLPPEEYGKLELLLTFSSILEVILSMGLYQVLYVFYFHHDKEGRKKLIDSLISIYLLLPSFLYVLVAIILFFTHRYFFSDTRLLFVYMAMLAAYLNFYVSLIILVLKLSQQAGRLTILQVGAGLLSISLNIYLIYFLRVGIAGILLSNLVSLTVIIFTGQRIYFKKFNSFQFHIDRDKMKEYLSLSLPFVPGAMAYWILTSYNRWIILHEVGLVALGIFSIAIRFSSMMDTLVIQPFLSAYSPRTMKKFSEGKYNQQLGIIFPVSIAGFLIMGFIAQWVAGFMIDEKYYGALPVIPVLFVAAAFSMLAQSTALLLLFRKKVHKSFSSILLGSIAAVVFSYLLAETHGVMGVAVSILIGNMVWAGFMYFFYRGEKRSVLQVVR